MAAGERFPPRIVRAVAEFARSSGHSCRIVVHSVDFHVTIPKSGHNGHSDTAKSRYEITRRAEHVPESVLRAFVLREAENHSYREIAKRLKASHETVRLIVEDPEHEIQRRTRQKLGVYYLTRHPVGYVAEKRAPFGIPEPLPPLKEVLPPGYEAARAEVEKLVELARRFPDEAPASAERLRAWLEKLLAAEYIGVEPPKRQRQRKKRRLPEAPPGAEPRDAEAAPEDAGEGEEAGGEG